MKKLAGKVAIVTGAGGGMGRAFAHRLAELGADVAIFDINLKVAEIHGEQLSAPTVMDELKAKGVRSIGIEADLSKTEQVQAAVTRVMAEFGRIDIVVNNAGGGITPAEVSTASMSPPTDTELLLAANFYTTVNVCQAAVPHLRKQGGAIVNITSLAAENDTQGARFAMYGAAKAAVLKFSRSLAVELGPEGIRVNCISPGFIETPRVKAAAARRNIVTADQAANIPLRRLGQSEDVVGAMEYLVTDMSSYVTGECIRVTGGINLVTM